MHAKFIPRDAWSEEDPITVFCIHGDKTELPIAEVYVEVNNQAYLMKVGVARDLPYPILLGTDIPIRLGATDCLVWGGY